MGVGEGDNFSLSYQKLFTLSELLDEEYALKLKEEELLAIGGCRRGRQLLP